MRGLVFISTPVTPRVGEVKQTRRRSGTEKSLLKTVTKTSVRGWGREGSSTTNQERVQNPTLREGSTRVS